MSTIPQEAIYNPDPLAPESGYYEVNFGMVRVELDAGREDWFVVTDVAGSELDSATITALRDQLWRADDLRRDLNNEPGSQSATARAVAEHEQRDAAFLAEFGSIIQVPAWADTDLEDALSDSPWPEMGHDTANLMFRSKISDHFELSQIARFDPATRVLELEKVVLSVMTEYEEDYLEPAQLIALIAEAQQALAKFEAVR